ncbi:MAG: helix-turn-helix transcriptional regulator, partial [Rhodoferax sp.]|nr:helix-turn-helix transcriptional regulator [Actinomycetota bacterium]
MSEDATSDVGAGRSLSTRAYLALITHPDADRDELAHVLGVDRAVLDAELATMAGQGSITVHGDGSWHVPPPDITLPARAGQLEREATRIRATADELAVIYHRARARARGTDQPIEVLASREEVTRYFLEVMGGARTRVRSLDRPPYFGAENAVTDVQRQQAADGVQFLSVYDTDVVEDVGPLTALDQLLAVGEQMRVLRGVPLKMVIADDDTALVIVRTLHESWRGSMLVRRSPLLDSLVTLFETLWRLAVPLPRALDQPARALTTALATVGDRPLARDHRVLMLLAGGATDETIARQLGVSTRTVERRVRALLDQLGAETRFQAGAQAARRGWL